MTRKVRNAAIAGWLAGGVMGALVCSGCASTGASSATAATAVTAAAKQPAAPDGTSFPPPEALEALPEPSPAQLASLDTVDVDRWDLTGPFPDQISVSPAKYQGGFGAALLAFAQQRGGTLVISDDMACVARETGRFVLNRGALPPQALKRHISGRCGSATVLHHSETLTGEAPEGLSQDALLEQWKDQFDQMLEKLPMGVLQSAGIWFGRHGPKVVVVVSSAERRMELDPMSFSPAPGGTVALKGKLLVPATHMNALVTRGRLQYGLCEVDPTVQLPRFSIRCKVSLEDPSAWISVGIYTRGQILGTVGADLLLFPQGKGSASYTRPVLRAAHGAPEQDGPLFAHLLNGLRAELGLAPVALSEGQSRVARKTAPLYFASMSGATSSAVADTVALGLMAGWEVEQMHHNAYLADGCGSGDTGALLAEMLASPGARRALFDPQVRTLALGALRIPARDFLGLLIATYAPFEKAVPGVEEHEVIDALNVARAEHGVGPAELEVLPPDVRAEMDKLLAAAHGSPKDALRVVLQRAVKVASRSMNGSVLTTGTLEGISFPDELLRQSPLVVFVAVTHHRPKGEPWGRYVVALAYASQSEPAPAAKPRPAIQPPVR